MKDKFDLEKILTMRVDHYCLMVGKKLTDYIPKGVKGEASDLVVPEGTEVVVDYHFSYAGHQSSSTMRYGMGVALIPKDYKPKKQK